MDADSITWTQSLGCIVPLQMIVPLEKLIRWEQPHFQIRLHALQYEAGVSTGFKNDYRHGGWSCHFFGFHRVEPERRMSDLEVKRGYYNRVPLISFAPPPRRLSLLKFLSSLLFRS